MNKPIHFFTFKLKEFRENKGWTQQQMADYLTLQLGEEIGRVTVTRWETQERAVNADKALAISAALKIQVMNLVEQKSGE